jgi:hypothetical protein
VAAIQRAMLSLEQEGGEALFGEPALELGDLLRTDRDGRGVIHILAADRLILKPRLYSSFLLWLLSELFESLPEVGDLDKPKLVFFFDEARLLFDDAPPTLRQRVEQVVRIIRSKGVGVYFCSQFPDDVPNEILGQLGNRIQHALCAYTPRDQKAVRTAAETFVPNPRLDVAEVISQLGVGEALVSTLQENGAPMPVERTLMCPAALPHGGDHARGARGGAGAPPGGRQVRLPGEPRVRLRDLEPADRGGGCVRGAVGSSPGGAARHPRRIAPPLVFVSGQLRLLLPAEESAELSDEDEHCGTPLGSQVGLRGLRRPGRRSPAKRDRSTGSSLRSAEELHAVRSAGS